MYVRCHSIAAYEQGEYVSSRNHRWTMMFAWKAYLSSQRTEPYLLFLDSLLSKSAFLTKSSDIGKSPL